MSHTGAGPSSLLSLYSLPPETNRLLPDRPPSLELGFPATTTPTSVVHSGVPPSGSNHTKEAKQALELMGRWEMIDVCDALELLSPLFQSEEVPFEEVPELVAGRRVLSIKGMHMSLRISYLSKALSLTSRKWTSTIREQERDPVVEALSSSYLGPDFTEAREFAEISIKDLDQVSKSSFPLCMSNLFEKLREDHHLKHGGRMQLGLFLKARYRALRDEVSSTGEVPDENAELHRRQSDHPLEPQQSPDRRSPNPDTHSSDPPTDV